MISDLGVGIKLANHGYAVFGIDYEGHGRSSGARCYIKRFDNIVNDCSEHFKSVCGKFRSWNEMRWLWSKHIKLIVLLVLINVYGFLEFPAKEEYTGKRRFLYGESMGGAVALLTHKKDPRFWDGAVLVAPMCKVVHDISI